MELYEWFALFIYLLHALINTDEMTTLVQCNLQQTMHALILELISEIHLVQPKFWKTAMQ